MATAKLMWNPIPPSFTQRGMSLIETLVAILLVSIGILGLLAFQGVAIANLSAAKYRTDASFLANQVIGALWANRQALEATPAQFTHRGSGGTGPGRCAPTGTNATHPEITNWLADVQNTLPGAVATAQQVRVEAHQAITVTVCWRAPGDTTWHNHIAVAQLVGSPVL